MFVLFFFHSPFFFFLFYFFFYTLSSLCPPSNLVMRKRTCTKLSPRHYIILCFNHPPPPLRPLPVARCLLRATEYLLTSLRNDLTDGPMNFHESALNAREKNKTGKSYNVTVLRLSHPRADNSVAVANVCEYIGCTFFSFFNEKMSLFFRWWKNGICEKCICRGEF